MICWIIGRYFDGRYFFSMLFDVLFIFPSFKPDSKPYFKIYNSVGNMSGPRVKMTMAEDTTKITLITDY